MLLYHTDSLDMLPRLDSASVSPLDQSHYHTNEEEHLSLLHTVLEKNARLLLECVSVSSITDKVLCL